MKGAGSLGPAAPCLRSCLHSRLKKLRCVESRSDQTPSSRAHLWDFMQARRSKKPGLIMLERTLLKATPATPADGAPR